MAENFKSERPWRAIAEEISAVQDTDKIVELSQELIEALDRKTKGQSGETQKPDDIQTMRKSA